MLLEELEKRQRQLNMTDKEFADHLGISRALWQRTRTEQMPVGKTLISAVYRRFPELAPQVLLFLGQGC